MKKKDGQVETIIESPQFIKQHENYTRKVTTEKKENSENKQGESI